MPTTLDALPPGKTARIIRIDAPGRWRNRLLQMGFTPGSLVRVVANHGVGPIIVSSMGITIAIGRGIARRILVEPL